MRDEKCPGEALRHLNKLNECRFEERSNFLLLCECAWSIFLPATIMKINFLNDDDDGERKKKKKILNLLKWEFSGWGEAIFWISKHVRIISQMISLRISELKFYYGCFWLNWFFACFKINLKEVSKKFVCKKYPQGFVKKSPKGFAKNSPQGIA